MRLERRINMIGSWRVAPRLDFDFSPSSRISWKLIRTNEIVGIGFRRKFIERSVDHSYGFHRVFSEKYRRRVSFALGNLSISIGFARGKLRQPGYLNRRPMGFHASLLA